MQKEITLPSERIARLLRSGRARYDQGVACGPLAALMVDDTWLVLHKSSGRQVGGTCQSGTVAILLAGALLAMTVDWAAKEPVVDWVAVSAAQKRIEEALQ